MSYFDEMLGNVPEGLIGLGQGLYDQATNPLAALQSVADYASHPLDTAERAYGHYARRYKNLPVAQETFRRDPVGAAMDFLPLAMMRRGAGLRPLEGEIMPPNRRPVAGGMAGREGPIVEGRAGGPGLNSPPPRAISGPPMPPPANSPPMSAYDRNMMAAYYRNKGRGEYGPYTPGARNGPFRAEDFGNYWQEGGQYFDPRFEDIPELRAVRNNQEFYSPGMMDELAARMQAGDRRAFREWQYGPNADRPNYGEAPAGPSPFERMPRPGVKQAPGPKPFTFGGEGKGYFGELPAPGMERPVPGPDGFVQRGGPRGGLPAGIDAGLSQEEIRAIPHFARPPGTAMTRSGGPIEGEFYDVLGLPGPAAARRNGLGRAMMMGAPAVAAGMMMPGAPGSGVTADVSPLYGPPAGNALGPMPVGWGQKDLGTFGQGQFLPPLEQARGRQTLPPMDVRAGKPKAKPVQKARGQTPAPAAAPEAEWEGNINYQLTSMLDRLFGQREAERGREQQQRLQAQGYYGR